MGVPDERFVQRAQKKEVGPKTQVVCVDCACAADRRAERACALINGHAQ